MKPPDIEAVGITKTFGALKAVDNVSLHLPPGVFHALLGENGAGKSTLVKCLMGFYPADQGVVKVNGEPLRVGSPKEARRHGIGMVFQHFTLVPSMTVAENLVLARPDLPNRHRCRRRRRRTRFSGCCGAWRIGANSAIC